MKIARLIRTAVTVLLTSQAGVAAAAQAVVPGSANPNLAGRADGYSCCSGDSTPAQAAVEVAGLTFAPTDVLTFDVSGQVSVAGAPVSGDNPDGDDIFTMTNYGDGISAPEHVKTNSLLGVFLGDESPTGGETPAPLSFLDSGLNFRDLEPALGQIFYIGDGLAPVGSGFPPQQNPQAFIVPAGATRLFLGTCDGVGWYNNTGSFTVDVVATPRSCGDVTSLLGVTSRDALFILNVAVGLGTCPACLCDVDGSGGATASDVLAVLHVAIGVLVDLQCPPCAG